MIRKYDLIIGNKDFICRTKMFDYPVDAIRWIVTHIADVSVNCTFEIREIVLTDDYKVDSIGHYRFLTLYEAREEMKDE